MSTRVVVWLGIALSLIISLSVTPERARAACAQASASFCLEEGVIGTGGLIESSSTNFKVTESVGDNAAGDSASTNFNLSSGSKTTNDPALAFAITDASAGFTDFSPATAATATSTFTVSNYTAYGYVVHMVGTSPKHAGGSHTIPAMGSTGPSVPGTEQFGMNLVANTSPINFGANPVHGYFAFGDATANYGTPNDYRFVSGEAIAQAPKSSGVTSYTISYIVNVTSLTPGGSYQAAQTLVVTGTY